MLICHRCQATQLAHLAPNRWFQVGGGCKIGAKSSSRLRQQREDGSWSDDGTAYQDDLDQDVDLSDDDEIGGAWQGDDDDDDESWGVTTPRTPRYPPGSRVLPPRVLSCKICPRGSFPYCVLVNATVLQVSTLVQTQVDAGLKLAQHVSNE